MKFEFQADKLRDYQVPGALALLKAYAEGVREQVNLSDTGTGKTFVACAVFNALKVPTVVVVPKIAITSWQRAAAHFNDSFSVINYEKLRTGRTPFGKWANQPPPRLMLGRHWVCVNCQRDVEEIDPKPCPHHPQGIHCVVEKKTKWPHGDFLWSPAVKAVVFDEVHRCGGIGSQNGELLIGAKRAGKIILGMSATAACSPLQLRALGYALDLHTLTRRRDGSGLNFYDWAGRYGCRRVPGMGFQWLLGQAKRLDCMSQIRDTIVPSRGVRLRTEDIPGFPERDITAELYDLEENGKIDECYNEMENALAELSERKRNDVDPSSALTVALRAGQKIELLKVPVAVELARDLMARGYSVALFCNYKQTVAELRARLECDCFIDGSPEGVRRRQQCIDDFQADTERAIVVNNKAGGICVNLHDLRGEFPRVGLVFPCFSAEVMSQVFGRLHRDGAKSKCHYRILLAAKTYDESIHRALSHKLDNQAAFNDADFVPENLKLTRRHFGETFDVCQ